LLSNAPNLFSAICKRDQVSPSYIRACCIASKCWHTKG
jgi:hypothetical protein